MHHNIHAIHQYTQTTYSTMTHICKGYQTKEGVVPNYVDYGAWYLNNRIKYYYIHTSPYHVVIKMVHHCTNVAILFAYHHRTAVSTQKSREIGICLSTQITRFSHQIKQGSGLMHNSAKEMQMEVRLLIPLLA